MNEDEKNNVIDANVAFIKDHLFNIIELIRIKNFDNFIVGQVINLLMKHLKKLLKNFKL